MTEQKNFNNPAYKRSRWAYTFECAFEYFIALMVADAFLATLLTEMGLSDAVIGVISSLISLAFLFQLFYGKSLKQMFLALEVGLKCRQKQALAESSGAAQKKILSFFRQIINLSSFVYINPTTGPYFFKLLYAYRIFHALSV